MQKVSPSTELLQLFKAGDYDGFLKAVASIDHSLATPPAVILAHGHALYEKRNYDKAIAKYTQFIQCKSETLDRRPGFYNRGLAYREIGEDEKAIADLFSAGIEYAKSRSFVGELLYLNSHQNPVRLKEAKKHLLLWLRKNPDDNYSRYWLGACYNQLDKPQLALRHMLKCLDAGYFTSNTVEGVVTELAAINSPDEIEELLEFKAKQTGSSGAATTRLIRSTIKSVCGSIRQGRPKKGAAKVEAKGVRPKGSWVDS